MPPTITQVAQVIRSPGEIEDIIPAKRKKLEEEPESEGIISLTSQGIANEELLSSLSVVEAQDLVQEHEDNFLPPEVFQRIVNFVSSFSQYGLYRVSSVSKKWKLLAPTAPPIQFEKLLRECLEDGGKSAIHFLAHKSCGTHFTHAQILSLCGTHIDFSKYLLADLAEFGFWSEDDLIQLSQHYEEVAHALIDNEKLFDQCNNHRYLIGENHYSVAQRLISFYAQEEVADTDEIISIVKNHVDMVLDFLESEAFQLSADDVIELSVSHPEVGLYVLSTAQLLNKFDNRELVELGLGHESVALEILKKHADKIGDEDIIELIAFNERVALCVLGEPSLLDRLSLDDLAMIGYFHPSLIESIWERFKPANTMSMSQLAYFGQNYKIAMRILDKLNDEHFYAKMIKNNELANIGSRLAILGKFDARVAFRILETPLWRSFLAAKDLVVLGSIVESIAMRIITDPELSQHLDGFQLAELAMNHKNVAMNILNNPAQVAKLNGVNLKRIGLVHSEVAKTILQREALAQQLDVLALCQYAYRHPGVSALLLDTPYLRTLVELNSSPEMNIALLEKRRSFVKHIHEKAYQYYKEHYAEDLYPRSAIKP